MKDILPSCIFAFLLGWFVTDVFTIVSKPSVATIWGEDLVKQYPQAGLTKFMFAMAQVNGPAPDYKPIIKYEFGLRSDGVVVWREIK